MKPIESQDKVLNSKILSGGGKRLSNIELLRIVSMLLVLIIHFVPSFEITSKSLYEHPLKSFVFTELHSISVVCVNCFILISGYFGIKWKTKSFASLIYQVLFWLILGFLIGEHLLGTHLEGFFGLTISYFSSRWFVPAYLTLYILSPALNSFIESTKVKQLGIYLLLFYTYSFIVGYILRSKEFNEGMSAISLVGLYLIGAYLRRADFKWFSFSGRTDLAIYISLSIFLTIIALGLKYIGFDKSPFGYINPFVILMSIYLFLFFKKLDIGEIKVINFIAASAFAVYLFHYHPFIVGFYQSVCRSITDSNFAAIVMLPILLLSVFTITVLLDQIRIYSFKVFSSIYNENPYRS